MHLLSFRDDNFPQREENMQMANLYLHQIQDSFLSIAYYEISREGKNRERERERENKSSNERLQK